MQRAEAEQLIADFLAGRATRESMVERLARPAADVSAAESQPRKSAALGEVTLDLDRQRRCGFPEVVYGEGKNESTLRKIFQELLAEGIEVLATRISPEKAATLAHDFFNCRYNPIARTFRVPAPAGTAQSAKPPARYGKVAVVTAGTSDWPVAEEAKETLDWMGVDVLMIHDVGVAGPHRLLAHVETLRQMRAVVVVAGMEGALPSVVGGHVDCPIVAVPTSVGYGANLGGLSALLSMLNSCAANVVVVNIDAGFKGGYVAGMIARQRPEGSDR